jgi:hypothetical protein
VLRALLADAVVWRYEDIGKKTWLRWRDVCEPTTHDVFCVSYTCNVVVYNHLELAGLRTGFIDAQDLCNILSKVTVPVSMQDGSHKSVGGAI